MGKGDKKSRRGKIRIGSFGVRRKQRKSASLPVPVKPEAKKAKAVAEEKIIKTAEEVPQIQEEQAVKKAAPKKPAKKAAEKPVEGEAKPKAVKPKKKSEAATEDTPVVAPE
jgi:30S ribosomal protein S31